MAALCPLSVLSLLKRCHVLMRNHTNMGRVINEIIMARMRRHNYDFSIWDQNSVNFFDDSEINFCISPQMFQLMIQ